MGEKFGHVRDQTDFLPCFEVWTTLKIDAMNRFGKSRGTKHYVILKLFSTNHALMQILFMISNLKIDKLAESCETELATLTFPLPHIHMTCNHPAYS